MESRKFSVSKPKGNDPGAAKRLCSKNQTHAAFSIWF